MAKFGMEKLETEKAYNIFTWDFFKGLIVCNTFAALYVFGPNKGAVLVGVLALTQWGNIITPTQTVADRYCSLASAFIFPLIAWTLLLWEPYGMAILCGLIGLNFAWSRETVKQYKNLNDFFDWNMMLTPKFPAVFGFKAEAMVSNGNAMGALQTVLEGLRHSPTDCGLNYKAAILCVKMGYLADAKMYIERGKAYVYTGQEAQYAKVDVKIKELIHPNSSTLQEESKS